MVGGLQDYLDLLVRRKQHHLLHPYLNNTDHHHHQNHHQERKYRNTTNHVTNYNTAYAPMEMIFIIIILLTNGKTTHAAMEIPSQLKSTQLFVNKAGPCRHLNNNNDDDDDDDDACQQC